MIHREITEKLKTLQGIEPDAAFRARLKAEILSLSPKKNFVGLASLSSANVLRAFSFGGIAVASVIVALVVFAPARTPAIASLENSQLADELSGLSINIQLEEIAYRNATDRVISSAITEIQNTETKHLNPSVIREEQENLEDVRVRNVEIDKLLGELTN